MNKFSHLTFNKKEIKYSRINPANIPSKIDKIIKKKFLNFNEKIKA